MWWVFEDLGRAKLVDGRAGVRLDPEFAAIVHGDGSYVYLTPEGECKGLSVANLTAAGFIVRELQGGRSSLTFAYRVVAKRKDIKGERLAKFAPPKINHPDPDNLPKPAPPTKP